MKSRIKRHLVDFAKKSSGLLAVIIVGLVCVPDVAGLKTMLFAVACVCIITAALALVIGVKDEWGVLPDVDFTRIVREATSTPTSCAEVIKGFLIFLGLVVFAIFRAS
jgi:hypothetical protein